MRAIKTSFKVLKWKLLLVIFLTLFVPAVYQISKVYFVGEIKDVNNYTIAGNLNWIDVIFEVLEEAFLLPLFFILNKFLKNKYSNKKIIGKFYAISLAYIIFIAFTIIFTKQLLKFMNVNNANDNVKDYVRVELFGRFFMMISKMVSIFLIAKNKWKKLIIFLTIKTVINIVLDFFIVGDNEFSIKAGIIWIALNELIITATISIIGLFWTIKIYKMKINEFAVWPLFLGSSGWKQNIWIGLESFVRNAFFIWFVLKTINKISEDSQGDFWVMNNFIWNLLLIPIIAISQYINREQAFSYKKYTLRDRLLAPFILTTVIIIIWLVSVPSWEFFIKTVMNNKNYVTIAHVALISIGFYIIFSYNNIIDKSFIGSGKGHLIFFQSLITNVAVFIPYYYLVKISKLQDVVIMMGLAIFIDSIITFGMFIIYLPTLKKI